MSKRDRQVNSKKIDKWLKEGRGQGELKDYHPWLTIRDVPSKGVVTRSKGWKTNRVHHLFSNLELHYFYTLEWSDAVIDIREQYPLLPLERTLEIAESLGIKHPTDPKTKEYIVMTTDFLISKRTKDGIVLESRTVKPSSELKGRTLEKFAIEQEYFREKGISWGIVTDLDKPNEFIKNMQFIYCFKDISDVKGLSASNINIVSETLFEQIKSKSESLASVALENDEKFGFEPGTCLTLLKYKIAKKEWKVDMSKELNPLNVVSVTKEEIVKHG
ncbi:TnsA endonuclease N-terminal domain-containing protein [Pontibacillus yanchengensis]|nr:TnsA endonuclease N-terminal domain-containing protein [Pontibacillus yanchengensis]